MVGFTPGMRILGIGWWFRVSDELIEQIAQGFIMSWADPQDGDNTLHPDSALMKLVDAHEDRDVIIQAGYRRAVDRFVTNVAKV